MTTTKITCENCGTNDMLHLIDSGNDGAWFEYDCHNCGTVFFFDTTETPNEYRVWMNVCVKVKAFNEDDAVSLANNVIGSIYSTSGTADEWEVETDGILLTVAETA